MFVFRSSLVKPGAYLIDGDMPLKGISLAFLIGDFFDNGKQTAFEGFFPGLILFAGNGENRIFQYPMLGIQESADKE